MSPRRVAAAVAACLVCLVQAAPARAEWFVTPFLGVKFAGATNFVDLEQGARNAKVVFGGMAGFVGESILGVEADVAYYPRFFERSSGSLVARSNVLTLMGNLIVTAPRNWTGYSLRPFVSGGGGLMHVGIDDVANIFGVDTNLFAINVGGGAVGGLTARTSVRFDVRYFKSLTIEDVRSVGFGPTRISFWRLAVGLTVR